MTNEADENDAIADKLAEELLGNPEHELRRELWCNAYVAVLRTTGSNALAKNAATWAVRDLDEWEHPTPPEPPEEEPRYLGEQ